MSKQLTMASLFDGSGGFPIASILCGIKPIWASEIEPFPIRVTTKRLPELKHYGNVSEINGADVEPVDIITFGSPCQDLSLAGKREGLEGDRSNLFYQAIRIIKEMREKTNGEYPRYAVWENVPGAFSSNGGADFFSVLQQFAGVRGTKLQQARPAKWRGGGYILADDWSLAWRSLDAQFWGVPQRRNRIFLVCDFDGQSAKEILFEQESVSRYYNEVQKAWQDFAETPRESIKNPNIGLYRNNRRPPDYRELKGVADPVIAGYGTARSNTPYCINKKVYENHGKDTRYKELKDVSETCSAAYGTGGNNQPLVVGCDIYNRQQTDDVMSTINTMPCHNNNCVVEKQCYDVRFTSENTKNARANVYETDTCRTLDTGGNQPDMNQGGGFCGSR